MRTRYTVLKSWNGQKIIIDNFIRRYHRMKHRIFTWADCVNMPLRRREGYRMVMVTLTYDTKGTLGAPSSWAAGHIRSYMRRLVGYMGKNLSAYAWVAELQQNGNVHYHVLVVFRGRRVPYPDRPYTDHLGTRAAMWEHGLSRIEAARTHYYVCKYVGKEKQKDFANFPANGHAWAVYVSDRELALSMRYQSLTVVQQRIVDEWGFEALQAPDMRPNYWRDDGDKLWYYGSYLSLVVAKNM